MKVKDGCPNCGLLNYKENGHIYTGKQNYQCKACGCQFLLAPDDRLITEEQSTLITPLLLEKILLRGICRAFLIGLKRLLGFSTEGHAIILLKAKTIISTTIVAVMSILLLASCTSATGTIPSATTSATSYPTQEYKINAGDQLDIKFFYTPELNEQVTVRPDGHISLQLINEVTAIDLTPGQLTDLLKKKYITILKNPEIAVIVRSISTQKIYVDGEVNKSGVIDLVGPMTIMQSIAQAGGVKDTGQTSEVLLIRQDINRKPLILKVNLDDITNGTDMDQNINLKAYDIVYIPKSTIAKVNLWVEQYIRNNIPLSFGISYNLNPVSTN